MLALIDGDFNLFEESSTEWYDEKAEVSFEPSLLESSLLEPSLLEPYFCLLPDPIDTAKDKTKQVSLESKRHKNARIDCKSSQTLHVPLFMKEHIQKASGSGKFQVPVFFMCAVKIQKPSQTFAT